MINTCRFALAASLFVALLMNGGNVGAQDQTGGTPGSSEGSPGMEEAGEQAFISQVQRAKAKGSRSHEYIGALVQLGLYYNRHQQPEKARRTLQQSLGMIDAGAMKPSLPSSPRPPLVEYHDNGTVSATNQNPPQPYEETISNLLPALATAEIACSKYTSAETHLKRLIAMRSNNGVADKLNLMSAYGLYAQLLHKTGRHKDAAVYERKADEINHSFKPL
jgi:tetratricopeptide (TPR) repeat protein